MSLVTVSVVIPAYNAAWCVRRAVDSVLAQTFLDFEIIVVDDGSTDGTAEALATYGEAIRILRKRNGGMSSARNVGIDAACGKYLAFLDADDRWLPNKLARQVPLLDVDSAIVFCSAVAILEDVEGNRVGEWGCRCGTRAGLPEIFANHSAIAGGASSVLARREDVVAVGGFDETLRGAEDTDLWIRLAARGAYVCVDEPLVVVAQHPNSVSRQLDSMRAGSLAMTRKNRHLLDPARRGAFWRAVYAGILCDYAKWECRRGRTIAAIRHVVQALAMAPAKRGRLAVGLLVAILRGEMQ